eukprot:6208049-Pleurochrysis_carterae.AAC.2
MSRVPPNRHFSGQMCAVPCHAHAATGCAQQEIKTAVRVLDEPSTNRPCGNAMKPLGVRVLSQVASHMRSVLGVHRHLNAMQWPGGDRWCSGGRPLGLGGEGQTKFSLQRQVSKVEKCRLVLLVQSACIVVDTGNLPCVHQIKCP